MTLDGLNGLALGPRDGVCCLMDWGDWIMGRQSRGESPDGDASSGTTIYFLLLASDQIRRNVVFCFRVSTDAFDVVRRSSVGECLESRVTL